MRGDHAGGPARDLRRWFRVQAIGTVRRSDGGPTDAGTFFDPWRESILEIDHRWADGLIGIEEYSHLVVLFWLDRATRRRASGPRQAAENAEGAPEVGFFATRSPRRPNPIGIACPRLVRRNDSRLIVRGIDAWDGTPLLDLKGYAPRDELRPNATVPGWLSDLWHRHDRERGGPPEIG